MLKFFVLGCVIVMVIFVVFFVYVIIDAYKDHKKNSFCKVKFEHFAKWYPLAPSQWVIWTNEIKRKDVGKVRFSFPDYIRYLIWLNQILDDQEAREESEREAVLLQAIQDDINKVRVKENIEMTRGENMLRDIIKHL